MRLLISVLLALLPLSAETLGKKKYSRVNCLPFVGKRGCICTMSSLKTLSLRPLLREQPVIQEYRWFGKEDTFKS
jgi:hypothetical protein